MKYKMICSDLDDTMITRDQKYGKGEKAAIKRYVDAGGKFVIVTGRMTAGALPVCRELDLHGEVLTYQGAVATDIDTEKTIDEVTIPYTLASEIGKNIESKGYYYQTYRGDYFYTQKATDFTRLYVKVAHAVYRETVMPLSDFIMREKLCPPKFVLLGDPKVMPSVRDDLIEKYGDELLINISKPFICEIIPHGVSKGSAVARLAERYGIKREEVICIGDSDNDLTMIEYAGLGVCVAGGSPAAKKAASLIAPDCDDDPITWLIDRCMQDSL